MANSKKQSRGRGRPVVYKGKLAKHIASLTRKHGATGARNILQAEAGSALAAMRSEKMVPEGLGISLPTILKIAKAQGVVLKRGRRNGSKAA